ncbi:response regulator transcription factor [Pedobacter polaris]|uniref:Response regulator transcription factor n=1 Tax=Pedobacter polaris TaxID=2571273 RepID=A0A4U1CFL8_9SPHI|nr:response regulator transcription factor [Pedobacter polaris]TKC05408.1 response regulator transcription factor [Pedobacter polaris]
MIKIILVEDHRLMLSSLTALLEKHEHIEVIAEVRNATELFALLESKPKVDLIISDILMPEMDGIKMIATLRGNGNEVPVILLSMLEDEKHSSAAFLAGANAYLSKNVEIDEVLFAINTVVNGKRYFSSELAISILERFHKQLSDKNVPNAAKISFSDRDFSVLELIADGRTNQEIADHLFLSRRTVEGIRQSILDRTGVKNSAALIKYAILNGYIGFNYSERHNY